MTRETVLPFDVLLGPIDAENPRDERRVEQRARIAYSPNGVIEPFQRCLHTSRDVCHDGFPEPSVPSEDHDGNIYKTVQLSEGRHRLGSRIAAPYHQ